MENDTEAFVIKTCGQHGQFPVGKKLLDLPQTLKQQKITIPQANHVALQSAQIVLAKLLTTPVSDLFDHVGTCAVRNNHCTSVIGNYLRFARHSAEVETGTQFLNGFRVRVGRLVELGEVSLENLMVRSKLLPADLLQQSASDACCCLINPGRQLVVFGSKDDHLAERGFFPVIQQSAFSVATSGGLNNRIQRRQRAIHSREINVDTSFN